MRVFIALLSGLADFLPFPSLPFYRAERLCPPPPPPSCACACADPMIRYRGSRGIGFADGLAEWGEEMVVVVVK